jgi:hypothetical protein
VIDNRKILLMACLVSVAPGVASAQVIRGERPSIPTPESRAILFQIGFGGNLPIAHLAATDERTDGYARTGLNIAFRSFIPFKEKIDLVVDLVLPRFKVNEGAYNDSFYPSIGEAFYKGKILSLGARWIGFRGLRGGDGYLMVTGGMYQLIYDRFVGAPQTITEGAFRPGAAIGAGVQLPLQDFNIDFTLRYHRFTDTGHFGLGDLSWLELGILFSFGG